MIRVYDIRGQGGAATSAGVDQLSAQLAQIPGVAVSTHDYYYGQQQIVLDVLRNGVSYEAIVITGFSLGANNAGRIADQFKGHPVALLYGIDPSRLAAVWPIPRNVAHAVCFWHPEAWYFGGAKYMVEDAKATRLEVVHINNAHLTIDWSPLIHGRIYSDVKALRHDIKPAS